MALERSEAASPFLGKSDLYAPVCQSCDSLPLPDRSPEVAGLHHRGRVHREHGRAVGGHYRTAGR
jgi:hypothetical protein